MRTTYRDGSANGSGVNATERPHYVEDCVRTLPLTDRRQVSPDLEATVLVDRRGVSADLEKTILVNRPSIACDNAARPTEVLRPYGYVQARERVDVRLAEPRHNGDTYDYLFRPSRGDDPRPGDSGKQVDPYGGRRPELAEPERRRGVGRRVLFTAGGLTLLAGVGYAAARHAHVGGAGNKPVAAAGPRPQSAGPTPSGQPATPLAHPTTPPANGGATGGTNGGTNGTTSPTQVATAPEYYVHNGPKGIALTLDDGPTSEYTPQILALLQQYGITATFCMIGRQIPPNAALVREVAAAGHAIANHTWDHADQTKLTASQVRDSMARTSEALHDVGITPSIYRAPYGSWNSNVFQACADAGLRPLDWSVDPQDWNRPGSSVIVQRILKQTSTGSIILEHDGGGDRSQTVAALAVVLPELLNAGYRFGAI